MTWLWPCSRARLRHGQIKASSALLDAALGSTGSPWIPEHRPGGFHSGTPSVCLRAAQEVATLEETFLLSPAFQSCHPPRLPARPLLQGPFPASHSYQIAFSNHLPTRLRTGQGLHCPGCAEGTWDPHFGKGFTPESRELRASGANAPVLHREQSLVCGLGTSCSRNAALTGHNCCCCAASLPGMGFPGHTLESLELCSCCPPQVLLSVLSSSTSPLQSALRSSTSPLPFPSWLDSSAGGE